MWSDCLASVYVNYVNLSGNCVMIPGTNGLNFIQFKFIHNLNKSSDCQPPKAGRPDHRYELMPHIS